MVVVKRSSIVLVSAVTARPAGFHLSLPRAPRSERPIRWLGHPQGHDPHHPTPRRALDRHVGPTQGLGGPRRRSDGHTWHEGEGSGGHYFRPPMPRDPNVGHDRSQGCAAANRTEHLMQASARLVRHQQGGPLRGVWRGRRHRSGTERGSIRGSVARWLFRTARQRRVMQTARGISAPSLRGVIPLGPERTRRSPSRGARGLALDTDPRGRAANATALGVPEP